MQKPVKRCQSPTTPSKLIVMTVCSSACRMMDVIPVEASAVDLVFIATWLGEEPPTCQNLIDLSLDAEIREEENVREEVLLPWRAKVSTRRAARLVMSQT